MKTFNCTQCGAAIDRVSLKDRWAHCDYCKAKFHLPEEKMPIVGGLSFGTIQASDPDSDGLVFGNLWIGAVCVLGIVLVVYGGVKFQENAARNEQSAVEQAKKERQRSQNRVTNVPVTVEWDRDTDDVIQYDLPTIDTSAFAYIRKMSDSADGQFRIVVEVKLDQDGRVVKTEAVSGNVLLQQYALKSAEMTVFPPAPKKKVRRITYIFG